MKDKNYEEELKYLEKYDISYEEKIETINNVYKLANLTIDMFMEDKL